MTDTITDLIASTTAQLDAARATLADAQDQRRAAHDAYWDAWHTLEPYLTALQTFTVPANATVTEVCGPNFARYTIPTEDMGDNPDLIALAQITYAAYLTYHAANLTYSDATATTNEAEQAMRTLERRLDALDKIANPPATTGVRLA